MSAKGKRHLGRVATVPCVVCLKMGLERKQAEVHHLFDSATKSDFLTAALCEDHHRGANGFHGLGSRAFEMRYKLSELDLLALTLERLEG